MPTAFPPYFFISSTASLICFSFLLLIITVAPSYASFFAIPRPIPVEDAVIKAILLLNLLLLIIDYYLVYLLILCILIL